MDNPKTPPLAFANQVIEMLAKHLLGDDVKLSIRAYRVMRVVYRRMGGSWFELCDGNPQHTKLLIETVKAWGAQK